MSKADQLGAGRFGGGVRPVSARRQAVAAATGVPTEGIAPPTELPVNRISLNPDNPRSSLGDLTDLAGSLKTHGQKQAITVMNRDAYIKANPGRETDLEPDTTHVVVDGSSRLAAARDSGLATIKVMVSDDQGTNPEELLESALVANIHRQDLEELDEARALQRLLAIHGSQRALARRLHRSQGWISQRLALLNLAPELQARIGEDPIDLLRAVGNKPADKQAAALDELKAERARQEQKSPLSKTSTRRQSNDGDEVGATDTHAGDYAVITSSTPADGSKEVANSAHKRAESPTATSARRRPVAPKQTAEASGAVEGIPEPREDSPTAQPTDRPALKRFPYEDGLSAAHLLIHKMSPDEFRKMLDVLIKHRDSQAVPAE